MIKIIKKYFIEFLALIGLIIGLVFAFKSENKTSIEINYSHIPLSSPYKKTIAGIGIIEGNSHNIRLGSFEPGIVTHIYVKEGDTVKQGEPLFRLDDRRAIIKLDLCHYELEQAKAQVEQAKLELTQAEQQFSRRNNLKIGINVSEESQQNAQFAFLKAQTQVDQQNAKFKKAKSNLQLAEVELDKLTLKSPIDALILKIYINPGEYISNFSNTEECMILGNIKPLHVRVQIDENDIWRFKNNLQAIGYLPGNQSSHFPLKFIRIDPIVLAKHQLKGDNKELIDTRILEIIYEIQSDTSQLYVGQKIEVYLETTENP